MDGVLERPSFLWPSQQAGDWSLHDIGFGRDCLFFTPPLSAMEGESNNGARELSDPPPRAHACVYIVVGSVRHGGGINA